MVRVEIKDWNQTLSESFDISNSVPKVSREKLSEHDQELDRKVNLVSVLLIRKKIGKLTDAYEFFL